MVLQAAELTIVLGSPSLAPNHDCPHHLGLLLFPNADRLSRIYSRLIHATIFLRTTKGWALKNRGHNQMQGGLVLGTTAFCGGDIDQGTTINNPAFDWAT